MNITQTPAKNQAKIDDCATRLGLHRAGQEWRGTCPACGYAADAFALSVNKDGHLLGWCASCQDRNAISAVLRGVGGFTPRAKAAAQGEAVQATDARRKAVERARVIWAGANLVTPDDPAGRYLRRRALAHLIGNPALRYREDVPHPTGGRHPAMVALVQGASGEPVAVHRTYLATDGHKACLEPVKASLGPVWGGAIRLAPAAAHIVIGEGIETAASAGMLFGLPSWAAISAGNLAKGLVLPAEVREITIAADDDGMDARGRNPGLDAAEAGALRWQAEGRTVRIFKPDVSGRDFNDIIKIRNGGSLAQ